MKRKNVSITALVVAALVAFFLFVPLPFNVKCAVEVKPHDAERVIVRSAGRLATVHVKSGQHVNKDEVMADIVNPELDLRIAEAERLKRVYEIQLDSLKQQEQYDPKVAAGIPTLLKTIASTEENLASLYQQRIWLEMRAPLDGTVLAPPEKKADPEIDDRLPSWSGSLLRPENVGAHVELDDVLCLVGDPNQFEALLVIDQADLPFIKSGLPVRIRLDAYADRTLEGTIDEIAKSNMQIASPSLSAQSGGGLATVTDAAGVQRPQSASYEAKVQLVDPAVDLQSGLRGHAKIKAAPQTLGFRAWRTIARTFHFRI